MRGVGAFARGPSSPSSPWRRLPTVLAAAFAAFLIAGTPSRPLAPAPSRAAGAVRESVRALTVGPSYGSAIAAGAGGAGAVMTAAAASIAAADLPSEEEAHTMGGRVVFFSFANAAYAKSMARILREARETLVFDEVHGYAPSDIEPSYFAAHSAVLNATRGSGFWAWKPYFLLRLLSRLEWGDVVMFADAGCEFRGNPQTYVDIARTYGFLGFRLPLDKHLVRKWTKGDIFRALEVDVEDFGGEKQHVGGIFLMQRTPRNVRFVMDWLRFAEDAQLVTDAPSISANHAEFQENRHDQAIYSLLIYKYGLGLVLEDRTFPPALAPIIYAARRRDE